MWSTNKRTRQPSPIDVKGEYLAKTPHLQKASVRNVDCCAPLDASHTVKQHVANAGANLHLQLDLCTVWPSGHNATEAVMLMQTLMLDIHKACLYIHAL